MTRHISDVTDLTAAELLRLLDDAARLKSAPRGQDQPLRHKIAALVFEKPSLRTRVSFEAAVLQLGGSSLFFPGSDVGLGWRESLPDFARTISEYVDVLVVRVNRHDTMTGLAAASAIPVINGLSDQAHPCQALADLLTVREEFGEVAGRRVVFVGDGNNVARSLALGCAMLGGRFVLACPPGYGFDGEFSAHCVALGGDVAVTHDAAAAVTEADVIYCDVWTSMGQEAEREHRLRRFAPYQVNESLTAKAPRRAIVLHCLPAKRGEEITDGVLDGPRSRVFRQAGNRLHAQKALLAMLLA